MFIVTDAQYSLDLYNSQTIRRATKKYEFVVEFEVMVGAEDMLFKLGATHNSAANDFPNLPLFKSGSGNVQIKFERGGVLSFGMGHSPEGMRQFNEMINQLRLLER